MSPYGVGGVHRHTPEMEQNLARRRRRAGHALVHADARADAARHPRHLHRQARRRRRPGGACAPRTRRRTPTSRSCTCCPRARGRRPARCSAATPSQVQVAVDERVGRVVAVGAIDNLDQGHRRAGGPVHEPRPRPRRDRRPVRRGSRAVSVTAAAGLPGRGRRRRPQGQRRARRRARGQRRPARTPPPASSPPTGSRPRPSSGRGRSLADGRLDAVVLNSGGANACTGPGGLPGHPRAPPSTSAEVLALLAPARSPSARPG